MMQAGRDYGTRMMRAKTPDKREERLRADLSRWLKVIKANQVPFRSVNQDKPKLHLK